MKKKEKTKKNKKYFLNRTPKKKNLKNGNEKTNKNFESAINKPSLFLNERPKATYNDGFLLFYQIFIMGCLIQKRRDCDYSRTCS